MRVNLTDDEYAKFIEEQRQIFNARMLDYFVMRKAIIEDIKKREDLEIIEEESANASNALRDMAHIAMLIFEEERYFDIDRRLFQLSPTASEYQYDRNGNAWIDQQFHHGEIIPDVPEENTHVIGQNAEEDK